MPDANNKDFENKPKKKTSRKKKVSKSKKGK